MLNSKCVHIAATMYDATDNCGGGSTFFSSKYFSIATSIQSWGVLQKF